MDSSIEVRSSEAENANMVMLQELHTNMNRLISGLDEVKQEINDKIDKKMSEGISAFGLEMKALLESTIIKTESDIKGMKTEVSEALKDMKMDLEATCLTLDVRMDKFTEESIQTQKGNIANFKEIWYAVEQLEKDKEEMRTMKAGLETSFTAMRTDLENKLAQISRDPMREEQRQRRAEENMDYLHERQASLDAEIGRINANIVELHGHEHNTTATLGHVSVAVEAIQHDLNAGLVELRNRVEQVASLSQATVQPEGSNGLDWFQDIEMGDSTMEEYSFMRDKDKNKSKNKRNKGHKNGTGRKLKNKKRNEEPDGSDSSSSSSSEESDNHKKGASRKRKDDSSDSSEDSSESDDPHAVLHAKRFKAGNRRASIIGDDEKSDSSSSEGVRKPGRSSIIYVQPSPPASDLCLEEVKIGKVLYFCKRFNNESSKFRGGLHAANYINERVLSQMRQEAYKHNIPGKHGILSNGKQQISNRQIFAILALMCAPANLEQMQLELSKSAWPRCKHDYKSPDVIIKNIADFRTDMLIYIDRFEDKLKLLRYHDKSAGYIPKVLFKKGGGNPGLADYFLAGLPDRNFGLRVWYSVNEDKRSRCKKWDKFIKLYMKAIELMEKREKEKEINKQICRGIKDIIKEEETKKREIASTRKVQRVHNLDEEGVIDLSGDLDEEDDYEEEAKVEEEALPSPIEVREDDCEEDGNESDITGEDLAQLANVLQPSDSKMVGVCYDMLYKGKCEKHNCPYSHKEEDIAKAKKLKVVKFQTPTKFQGSKSTPSNKANQNLRRS